LANRKNDLDRPERAVVMGAGQQGGKTVLIVEDDGETRAALQAILESEGHRVAAVTNGREAINYLHRSERPGLILLDLMMPVMSGWEFRSLQRRDPGLSSIPVVVCSAADDLEQEVSLLGAAGCLQKPINAGQLLAFAARFCH
jgi:CheY-like chemotaxis protein